jgi:hypothetical protein
MWTFWPLPPVDAQLTISAVWNTPSPFASRKRLI